MKKPHTWHEKKDTGVWHAADVVTGRRTYIYGDSRYRKEVIAWPVCRPYDAFEALDFYGTIEPQNKKLCKRCLAKIKKGKSDG